MIPARSGRLGLATRRLALAVTVVLLAACSTIKHTPPEPTPADFHGIASEIVQRGIGVSHVVSGDGGCDDTNLAKTAIAFDVVGLDQPTPVHVFVYIFRNRATYERLRASVDTCARSYVTDPETYETVETSPFVLAGQGPWGPQLKDNLRAALVGAAGTGN
jgi:hypothetical protein